MAALRFKVGDRSGVVADALSAAFDLAREGSPMPERSALEFVA